jgi:hypothetical protein
MAMAARNQQGRYFGDAKTIINRTNRVLVVRVNNVEWEIDPGENVVPAFLVPYAVRQHPRPGTMLMTGQSESLIAVPGTTPEELCTMIDPAADRGNTDLINRVEQPLVGEHLVHRVAKSASIEGAMTSAQVQSTLENTQVGNYD